MRSIEWVLAESAVHLDNQDRYFLWVCCHHAVCDVGREGVIWEVWMHKGVLVKHGQVSEVVRS